MRKISKKDLKTLMAQDKIPKVIEDLFYLFSSFRDVHGEKEISNFYDQLILLSGRLEGINQEISLGIADSNDAKLEKNRINYEVINLINSLPKEIFLLKEVSLPNKAPQKGLRDQVNEHLHQEGFEFDIFLSFSSKDRDRVKPIWEALRGYGLKVFLSDESLKINVGQSFMSKIEYALKNSQHFVLVCSPNSMDSEWVNTEYETFYNEFFIQHKEARRLIVLKGVDFKINLVPLLLRRLQIAASPQEIIESLINETIIQKQQEETERQAAEEKKRKQQEELERQAAEEKKRKQQEELERQAAEEKKRKQQEELERQAAKEKKRKQQEELERQAAEEKKRKQQEELERQAAEEKKRKQQEEAERQAAEEKKRKQQEELERQAAEEKKRKQQEEAERYIIVQKFDKHYIKVKINDEFKDIPNNISELRALMQAAGKELQIREDVYPIEDINETTWASIQRQSKLRTYKKYIPHIALTVLIIIILGVVINSQYPSKNSTEEVKQISDSGIEVPKPEMIFVKGGTFQMGSNQGDKNEKPVHTVTLSDFYIGKYEVSNAEYAAFLNAKGNQEEGGVTWIDLDKSDIRKQGNRFVVESAYENYPVIYVSWYGAKAYCEWAGGILPTEAQWEYAARGGQASKGYKYAGSNNIDEVAWYDENSGSKVHPQGQKQPNELGIYDMSGNVWEWCQDFYDGDFYESEKAKVLNPINDIATSSRLVRGGSWIFYGFDCRVSYRYDGGPGFHYDGFGFRLSRVSP